MFQTKLDQALHQDVVLNLTVGELREFCDFMEMRDDNQTVAVQFSLSAFGSGATEDERLDFVARQIFDENPELKDKGNIHWIKALRGETLCSLKDAKESVDRVIDEIAQEIAQEINGESVEREI